MKKSLKTICTNEVRKPFSGFYFAGRHMYEIKMWQKHTWHDICLMYSVSC